MQDQKLQDLIKQANEGLEGVSDSHNRCIAAAIRCGDALNEAKELVEHGEWETFLKKNFDGSLRTAQRYMRVARSIETGQIDLKNKYTSLLEVEEDITEIPFPSDGMNYHRDDGEPTEVVDDTIPERDPKPPRKPIDQKKLEAERAELAKINREKMAASDRKDAIKSAIQAIERALSLALATNMEMVAEKLRKAIDRSIKVKS